MSNDNAGQVLFQVQSLLRNSSLTSNESSLLAFQLLVWAHLSAKGKLDADLRVDAALPYGATGIVEALNRLAVMEGVTGHAFGDAPRRAQFSADYIVSAVTAAKRLAEGGIFERFSPAAIAADLVQSGNEPTAVPAEVVELMIALAVEDERSSVYCPWESTGQFVGALLSKSVSLYVETPYSTSVPALLSLFREARTEMVLSNPLYSPTAIKGGHLQRFDAALSIPPWNMAATDDVVMNDMYSRFPVKKATGNGLNVQHILAQTEGKAAIILPNNFLFGTGRDREVREYLLNKGWVEAVIALPAGLFNWTSVPSALLVLNTQANHRSVGFVDATQPHFTKAFNKGRVTLANTDAIVNFCSALTSAPMASPGNVLDDSLATVITVEEILANEASLQIDRYVMASEQRDMQARLETMETETLEDVVEVLNPISNKDRGVDSPTAIEVYEVGAADLPSTGYIRTPEKTVKVKLSSRRSGDSGEIFLRPYDLVLIVKGSAGKIGIVPKNVPPAGKGGWIAGQSAVVLRARDASLDLRGLGFWLRSDLGQKLLGSIKSGTTIPMMSIATLRRLKVIAMSPAWTELSIDALEQEDDLQYQIDTLRDQQASIAEDLWSELLKSGNK